MFLQGRKQFPGDPQYVTCGRIHWELKAAYLPGSDRFVFVVCELDKVAERYTVDSDEVASDELLAWLYVLAQGWRNPQEMEDIMDKVTSLKEFDERYGLAMGDPDAWDEYWHDVARELERNDMIYNATEEGYNKGYKKGQDALVEALKAHGVDEEVIRLAIESTKAGN